MRKHGGGEGGTPGHGLRLPGSQVQERGVEWAHVLFMEKAEAKLF